MSCRIDTVAFEKTGTLTEGKPTLVAAVAASGHDDELLSWSAAIQAGSEHPLARAVMNAVEKAGLALLSAAKVRAVPGRGMSAEVQGRALRLGSPQYMQELGVDTSALAEPARQLESDGRTVSWRADVTEAPALVGMLAFGDAPKASSIIAIRSLQALGIRTVTVTGDNEGSATAVGSALGIDHIEAQVLPTARRPSSTDSRKGSLGGHGRRRDQRCSGAGLGRRGHCPVHRHRCDHARRRHSACGGRFAEPGGGRCGHGVEQRQRVEQCAAAAGLETPRVSPEWKNLFTAEIHLPKSESTEKHLLRRGSRCRPQSACLQGLHLGQLLIGHSLRQTTRIYAASSRVLNEMHQPVGHLEKDPLR